MAAFSKHAWRTTNLLTIGEFEVDPQSNELRRDTQTQRLRPILMDVLLRLAASPNEVIGREQLLTDVWSRRMVNDEVLSRAVAELRTLLSDDAKQPRYIETLPKVGYRLIAAVHEKARQPDPPQHVSEHSLSPNTLPSSNLPKSLTPLSPPTPPTPFTLTPARSSASGKRRWIGVATITGIVSVAIAVVLFSVRTGVGSRLPAHTTSATAVSLQLGRAASFSADADFERSPRFSSNGARVVYAQGSGRQSRLVVRETGGQVLMTISKPNTLLLSPLFDAADRSLIYAQSSTAHCGIVERQFDTELDRTIIDCARAPRGTIDRSPDGKFIAVSLRHRPEFPRGIALVRVRDGDITMLTTPQPNEGEDMRPRFSPDGSRLVFSRGTDSQTRLWMLQIAVPSSAKPLLAVEGLDYGVAWLGQDGPLLVSADWSGARTLNVVDFNTGKIESVGAHGAKYPDISPDGSIIYESARYRADLWLTDAAQPGVNATMLWPSSRYTSQPSFSPNGKQLAFVSNREGAGAIYLGNIDNIESTVRKLTLSADFRHMRPRWSIDGKHLFAVRSPIGAHHVETNEAIRIDLATGNAEVLSALGKQVVDVRELPDRSLLVAESANNALRLHHYVDGRSVRLPFPLVSEFQTRGDELVFLQPGLSGLTRCQLSTQQCAPLDVAIAERDLYHWHLGNQALWYRASTAKNLPQLNKIDLISGKTQHFSFVPNGQGSSIAASPDGKTLVVSREAPVVIDLMLARK